MSFQFRPSSIPDVVIIEPQVFGDSRGFFLEIWNERAFSQGNLDITFVQDNHSGSSQGVLRGLHYQVQQPQGKLIRCIVGEVFDVSVDLRRSSPTFGQWVGITLSAENKKMCWIPPGFAHGFYVISPFAEFQYKCTTSYAPEYERSIAWNDADLKITWPLLPDQPPRLSKKDQAAQAFKDAKYYP